MLDGGIHQQEDVRGAFLRSLAFHGALVGGLALYAWLNGQGEAFGDPNAGGATVGIEMVAPIPLPSRGPQNPVANDTQSEVPQEIAKPAPKAAPEPEPEDALALLPPDKKSKQTLTPKNRLKSFDDLAPNQLTSKSAPAVSSPLFGTQAGASDINLGGDTTLGNRFPEYAANIKELTRARWLVTVRDVDRSVTTAPPVTVRFTLQRSGKVTGLRLIKRSGIASLDLSVQNAVEEAHYPELPSGFDGNSAVVEFTMVLKR